MKQAFKLLVFDWDGTLMDSEARIVTSIEAAIEELRAEPRDRDSIRNIIGLGLHEAVSTLYPESDMEFHHRLRERYRHHFLEGSEILSELFPGVRDMLHTLHARGLLLAVATGKGRAGLDRVLLETGCDQLFHASRCADEARSKPHPQMLIEIMEELEVEPGDALMIGDTEYDLQMARAAGTASLAVSYGVHRRERLLEQEPVACVGSVSELQDWLAET